MYTEYKDIPVHRIQECILSAGSVHGIPRMYKECRGCTQSTEMYKNEQGAEAYDEL